MDLPPISETCVWHAYARLPSICTMQAPHRPVPQPNLVPVSLRPSRITHNNRVAGGASVDAALPFTMKLVDMVSSPDVIARDASFCLSCGTRNVPECPISAAPPASSENRFLFFQHDSDYSAVTPVNLMTSAHFRVSSSMNLAKSVGEPANMSQPRSAKRAFMPASSSAALICLFSLSTIAGGVHLGATM